MLRVFSCIFLSLPLPFVFPSPFVSPSFPRAPVISILYARAAGNPLEWNRKFDAMNPRWLGGCAIYERCKCKTIKWRIDRKNERGLEIFFVRVSFQFPRRRSLWRDLARRPSPPTSNGHSIIDRSAVISSVCRDRSECLEYHSSVGRFPFDLQ